MSLSTPSSLMKLQRVPHEQCLNHYLGMCLYLGLCAFVCWAHYEILQCSWMSRTHRQQFLDAAQFMHILIDPICCTSNSVLRTTSSHMCKLEECNCVEHICESWTMQLTHNTDIALSCLFPVGSQEPHTQTGQLKELWISRHSSGGTSAHAGHGTKFLSGPVVAMKSASQWDIRLMMKSMECQFSWQQAVT